MSEPTYTPEGTVLDPCGCCEPPSTEDALFNRPGLPALRYRVGTHATFLRRMLARLPLQTVPSGPDEGARPLQALTTRARDDASIALLDAWATVGDVLTFYQQFFANEAFLRTATERRSVLELARKIGYELSPGVAASTYVAFTVEQPVVLPAAVVPPEQRPFHGAPGTTAPPTALVPAGTQVQSVPGPDESPQTYETLEALEAHAAWNALRPRLTQPQPVHRDAKTVWVEGIVTDLKPGGWVLVLADGGDGEAVPFPKRVLAVTPEDALGRTRIDLAGSANTQAYQAFSAAKRDAGQPQIVVKELDSTVADGLLAEHTWTARDFTAHHTINNWPTDESNRYFRSQPAAPSPPAPSLDLTPLQPGFVALTVRTSPFGHNAPVHSTLARQLRNEGGIYQKDWDANPPTIETSSQGNPHVPGKQAFYLERVFEEVLPGGWVVLETDGSEPLPVRIAEVRERSLADYGLSGRATGIVAESQTDLSAFRVRTTTIHAGSRPLVPARLTIEEDIGKGTGEAAQLTLDGPEFDLAPGRIVAVTGERADLPGVVASEVVTVSEVFFHDGGLTTLFFASALRHRYVRRTVTLNANVVAATHGESVTEVLGSGNGAAANQRFTLKKPPLTFVSASTPAGIRSTLEVRVNELLWEEVPSLYALPPDRRAYTIRLDDDGKARVDFGDGEHGARLPTGIENVVGRYRSGIGLEGEVDAGSLTVLQTRPLGIREVTNPVPATGAQDPESLDEARPNAPLTVRTLDRIVSLQDYTDFARGFAGIGKAEAVALWTGHERVVSITIASASGVPVERTSALYGNLHDAIAAVQAGFTTFHLDTFQPRRFHLEARVLVDAAHETEAVLEAVEAELLDAFGFARRSFAQGVTAAEVVATMHRVPGVVAVRLEALHFESQPKTVKLPAVLQNIPAAKAKAEAKAELMAKGGTTLATLLRARPARWENGAVALAELLLVNPAGVTLREMAP